MSNPLHQSKHYMALSKKRGACTKRISRLQVYDGEKKPTKQRYRKVKAHNRRYYRWQELIARFIERGDFD